MFDDNLGYLAHTGIPDFHELDQHLEALLLRGVRITVALAFLLLFRFSPLLLLFISLLFNSSSTLLLLFPFFLFILAQHRITGAVVLVPLCSVLIVWVACIFMRLLFEKLTRIVLLYLLDLLPTPLLSDSYHSYPVFFCYSVLSLDLYAWPRLLP